MGRILDARGDEALDVLAELIEPVSAIAGDPEISGMMQGGNGVTVGKLAAAVLRSHKDDVVNILAIDDGKTPDEERGLLSALTIPARLLRLLSVPAVKELLFGAAAANGSADGSSAASESGNG